MRAAWQRLRRLLAVEPGEGAIVAWSAAALFLVESASVAVSNVSDTLFLKRVGAEYLPVIFLANSLLLTATTFGVGRLALRFDPRRLITNTFSGLALLLALLWVLLLAAAPGIATILAILSKQIDVIALLLFWTVIGGLMTSRQSKRLMALMTAGGTLGTITGSFTSGPFGELLGIPSLLAMAALAFAAAAVATVPLTRSAPPRLLRAGTRVLPPSPPPRVGAFWRESSLFRVLVLTSFLAGVLGPMLYFEFSYAADLATRTADGEQRLLALYGMLRGWINVGVLAVQVGVSAALFRRVGVPLAAALAPAAYLGGFAGLALKFGLGTAMPATMGTSVLDHTVYDPAQRILGALLPQRMRTAATSVIQGPAKRGGAALGSLLILLVVAVGDPSHVALAALPFAGLWMLLALSLWRNYPNHLLEAASVRRGEDDEEEPIVTFLDPGTLRTLQQNLEGSDPGLCRAACGLFLDAPAAVAVLALARALPLAPPAHRTMLVEALDRALADPTATATLTAESASSLVRAFEASGDLGVVERAKLLHVLGRAHAGIADASRIPEAMQRACDDDAEAVAVAARLARLRAASGSTGGRRGDTAFRDAIDEVIGEALASDDPATRSIGVAELRYELLRGEDDGPARTRRLGLLAAQVEAAALCDAADADGADSTQRWRREAVEAMADAALHCREEIAACVPAVMALLSDDDPAVRAAVLRFIGHARLVGHAVLLTERLACVHDTEARAARKALEELGPDAADALLHALHHGCHRTREIVPGLLRDLQADPATLEAVIDREIEHSREMLMVLGVLDEAAMSRLLLQRIRERVDESMQTALELLAAVLREDRIARVSRTLGRGWNLRDRAVLLEALEALLPASESARILPLLEEQGARNLAARAARDLGRPLPTVEEALVQVLASRDSLTVGLVAATVDAGLLARAVPDLDVEAAERILSTGGATAGSPAVAAGGSPASLPSLENDMLSPVEKMLHLRNLDLFEELTTPQLSELSRVVTEVKVGDGEAIVSEGEYDDSMYFIVVGNVLIVRGGQGVAELGVGDFFGEMSVFDGEKRSATAIARGEVRLLRLTRNDLFDVMEDQPAIGIGICQILVRRVRNLLDERSGSEPHRG